MFHIFCNHFSSSKAFLKSIELTRGYFAQVWKAHTRATSTTFPTSSSNHNLTIDYTFFDQENFLLSKQAKWNRSTAEGGEPCSEKSAEGLRLKRKCNFSAQTAKWLVLSNAFLRFAQIGTSQIFLLNFSHLTQIMTRL